MYYIQQVCRDNEVKLCVIFFICFITYDAICL